MASDTARPPLAPSKLTPHHESPRTIRGGRDVPLATTTTTAPGVAAAAAAAAEVAEEEEEEPDFEVDVGAIGFHEARPRDDVAHQDLVS